MDDDIRGPFGRVVEPLDFRGTRIGQSALQRIRNVIRSRSDLTRGEIARRLCKLFGWKLADGRWAMMGCRRLLDRLAGRGLVRLPGTARRGEKSPRQVRSSFLADDPGPLLTSFERPAEGTEGVIIRPIHVHERAAFSSLMERHHYLGNRPTPGESIRYVGFAGREPAALLVWSSASFKNTPRDSWIGWDARAKEIGLRFVATNVRFLVLPQARRANLASQVLGANIRRLSRDWEMFHGHPVLLLETFVDETRFAGTCYRASNWFCLGRSSGWSRRGRVYVRNNNPKAVFVYPLHRHARERLCEGEGLLQGLTQKGGPMMLDTAKLPLDGQGGLIEVLRTVVDPRKRRGIRHPIVSIFAMATAAVLSGARSLVAIGQWVEEAPSEILRRLGCTRKRGPSETTIRRMLKDVEVDHLEDNLGGWLAANCPLVGKGIAIDGKTLKGSSDGTHRAAHLVSAVVHQLGVVLAQTRVDSKTNELKTVKPLLEGLNTEGAVITGDAMFTQKEVAEYVVNEKHADYVLTVKGNQPTLETRIDSLELEAFSPSEDSGGSGPRPSDEPLPLGE